MKKIYKHAEIDFVELSLEDVIRTSKPGKEETTTAAPTTSPVDTTDDLPWDYVG